MPQPWKHPKTGVYYYRKVVPKALRPAIGQTEFRISLGTKTLSEAKRLYPDAAKEIDTKLLVASGGAIRLSLKQQHALIGLWYQRALEATGEEPGNPDAHSDELDGLWETLETGEIAAGVSDDLDALLRDQGLQVTPEDRENLYALLLQKEMQLYRELIRRAGGDWSPDPTIAKAPAWEPLATVKPATRSTFAALFDAWVAETKPSPTTIDRWRSRWDKLAAHTGKSDPGAVTKQDVISWKDSMVAAGLSPKTINNDALAAVKTVYNWALANLKTPSNPTEGVRVATGKRRGEGKLPYTRDEAKAILEAARKEEGLLRWVPWLEALSGARVSEVVECLVSDVREADGIHYLNIEADAEAGKSTKTESSDRLVPLHPHIIAEGFLEYAAGLPKDGPLFPEVSPNKHNRRGPNGSRTVARWVRNTVGLIDPRKSPNHAWRHWFIGQCRAVGEVVGYGMGMSKAQKTLNALQETPWRIDPEALAEVERRALTGSDEVALRIAQRYREWSFYFPYGLDDEGRARPIPMHLHPEGSELARSLLVPA